MCSVQYPVSPFKFCLKAYATVSWFFSPIIDFFQTLCMSRTWCYEMKNQLKMRPDQGQLFLAHLSTKCSWWAIVVSGCPSSVVVRQPSSVVCRPSTFDVYTLETTFVIRFLWNLVRMFVLTISRVRSIMGHDGSKTRSPGQILGNSCLHSRGHICDTILMKHVQNVCFDNI